MKSFLAHMFLAVASLACMLGNFWFTYGIWPRSWGAFALFGTLSLTILVLGMLLRQEEK